MRKVRMMMAAVLFALLASECWGYTVTVYVNYVSYVPCPHKVTGTVYTAADGTTMDLHGSDPYSDSSYGGHGVPKRREEHLEPYQVEIPDYIYKTYVLKNDLDVSVWVPTAEINDEIMGLSGDMNIVFRKGSEKIIEYRAKANRASYEEEGMSEDAFILEYGGEHWDDEYQARYEEIQKEDSLKRAERKKESLRILEDKSVKIGDPVLMSSGQFWYDLTDFTARAGAMELKIGHSYQSGRNLTGSLGRKWFFTLDTGVFRGTDVLSEEYYEELLSDVAELEKDLAKLRQEKDSFIEEMDERIDACTGEADILKEEEKALAECGYTGEIEISSILYKYRNNIDRFDAGIKEMKDKKATFLSDFEKSESEICGCIAAIKAEKENLYRKAVCSIASRKLNEAASGYGTGGSLDIGTDVVILQDAYGHLNLFKIVTSPDYTDTDNLYPHGAETEATAGSEGTLRINEDGTYTYSDTEGKVWNYGKDGRLRSVSDRYGNGFTLEYAAGRVAELLRNGVTLYTLEWQGGLLRSMTNSRDAGEKIELIYSSGILAGVKDGYGDVIRYGYLDGGGDYLSYVQKPDGSKVQVEYGYVKDGKRLVSRTCTEEGFWEQFSYSQNNSRVEHVSQSGEVTVYEYDDSLRLARITNGDGSVHEYEYNSDGSLRLEKNNGLTTRYGYDAKGRLSRKDYPDGTYEAFAYDSAGNMVSRRDRSGNSTELTYDRNGNITGSRTGGVTGYTYSWNGKGQMAGSVMYRPDGTDFVRSYAYDADGNLVRSLSGTESGNAGINTGADYELKEWTYDGRNRILSLSINGRVEEKWSYSGRRTVTSYRNGLTVETVTDSRKDCIYRLERDTVTGLERCYEMTCDKSHEPVRISVSPGKGMPALYVVEYRYLPAGELEAELYRGNGQSYLTIWEYEDKAGRNTGKVTAEKKIACTEAELMAAGWTESSGLAGVDIGKLWNACPAAMKYSSARSYEIVSGTLRQTETDAGGSKIVTVFDGDGDVVSRTDGAGATITYERDGTGREIRVKNVYGGYTESSYDSYGNLASYGNQGKKAEVLKSSPDGYTVEYTGTDGAVMAYRYDGVNRLRAIEKETGTTWFSYDYKGRLVSLIKGGDGTPADAVEYETYSYGDDDRSLRISYGGLYEVSRTYDAWGQVLSETDGEGNRRRYEYDCRGNVTAEYDAYGNVTIIGYDSAGNRISERFPDGTWYEYSYDALGNMTEKKRMGRTVWSGSYDGSGRLVEARQAGEPVEKFVYDGAGRITGRYSGGTLVEKTVYGTDSRRVTVTDGRGNSSVREYDVFGNLVLEKDRLGNITTCSYGADGYLSGMTLPSGRKKIFSSGSGGLEQITGYSDGSTDCVGYSFAGRVVSLSNGAGTVTYGYDKGGRLISEADSVTGETVSFRYDRAGRRIAVQGAGRNIVITYGRNDEVLEVRDYSRSTGYRFEYDNAMREVRRTADNGVCTCTSYTPEGLVETVTVKDRSGRLLSGWLYVYDGDDTLVAAVNEKGEVILYERDAMGRLSAVLYPDTEEYAWYEDDIAATYGMAAGRSGSLEGRFLSGAVYDKAKSFMAACGAGSRSLPSYQNFRVERFTYDGNGNRISWSLNGGRIEFTYDAEDNLTAARTDGRTAVSYRYDADGNLTGIEDLLSAVKSSAVYGYDGSGRLVRSTLRDGAGLTVEGTFSYDACGRQTESWSSGAGRVRNLYAGLGSELLQEYSEKQYEEDSSRNEVPDSGVVSQGERYRFITESNGVSGRYGAAAAGNGTNGYVSKSFLYAGGEVVAVESGSRSWYYGKAADGNISCVTDSYGNLSGRYAYDVFGSLIGGSGGSSSGDASGAGSRTGGFRMASVEGYSPAAWGRRDVIMDDLSHRPILDFKDAEGNSTLKSRINMEVHRKPGVGYNNYNNDVEYLMIGNQVIARFDGIQSEKNMMGHGQDTYLATIEDINERWRVKESLRPVSDYSEEGGPCATLPLGTYSITRIVSSGSYYYPLVISSDESVSLPDYDVAGVNFNWYFMLHSSTNKKNSTWYEYSDYKEFYELYNEYSNVKPADYKTGFSLGCQVSPDSEHRRLNLWLDLLGVKPNESITMNIKQKNEIYSK